jgi:threonine dehydrogenase-like Zn-dependent dehydrogenase
VLTIDGTGRFAVVEERIPVVRPGTVLVEVRSSLVSPGTELGGVPEMRRKPDVRAPRRAFGYGNAGVVLRAGDGVKGIDKGARVACMGSGHALHATHAVVPVNLTAPIPEGLSFDEAAFAHLAATGLHAVRRGQVQFGNNTLVMGLGLVGQLTAQFARAAGAHVMGVDMIPMRLETARKWGIDLAADTVGGNVPARAAEFTGGKGVEVAFLAFGGDTDEAMRTILDTLVVAPDTHRMGVIVIVGGARFESSWPVPFGNVDVRASSRPGPGYHDDAWEHGADYPRGFVQWTTRRNIEESLRAAAERRVDFKALITHTAPLGKGPEACEEIIEHPDRALGVILRP